MNTDRIPMTPPAFQAIHPFIAMIERLERQAAAQALHTIPDPMTARERAEREAASGEMG